jgi:hypothetical protein
MGILQRGKAAFSVIKTGKLPNPLASPKNLSRAALVKELNDWCSDERKFWKPVFDRMRQEERFAAGKQWQNSSAKDVAPEDEEYVGDTMQQMVNRKLAALYSKNPTPEAVLRERMNFAVWDGKQETIDACKALVAQIAPQAMQMHEAEQQGQQVPVPPSQMMADLQQAQQLMDDYNQGMAEKAMLDKVAQTGELLIKQQWDAQTPDLLASAKLAVAQIIVARVAYAKVMYHRDMAAIPTETANTEGFTSKIQSLQAQLKEIEDDITGPNDSRTEEVRLLKESIAQQLQEMQQLQEEITDEGIVIDWLSPTSVIIDRRCRCLTEFIGAHRVAHEILMTVHECEAKFGVSLRDSGAKIYSEHPDGWKTDQNQLPKADENEPSDYGKNKVCVWEIQDKDDGLVYTVCDGVKDFLKEPSTNEPEVNRFWSIIPIKFNAQVVETNDPANDCTIFSRSDVRLAMPMQINMNKAGQERRTHRAANRPGWITFASVWAGPQGQSDLSKLAGVRNAHDVFQLATIHPDQKINDVLVPLPKQPFDQNLYDNSQDTQAMMLATGVQASDIGMQRPDEKATGQNIAAQQRASSESSNIDDLNFAWSTIAQMMWEMLISPKGMSQEQVVKRVGRGGTWADVPIKRSEIAESVFFRIEAGSMGSPNQQAELQKVQVVMPQLIQMFAAMGKSPEPLAKMLLKRLDANIDLDQLLKDAQVLPPPAPQTEQQRPPSVSISANLKDLPPEEQNQAVEKFYGLKSASPASTLINKAGHGAAIAAHHQNANPQPPAQPAGNQRP